MVPVTVERRVGGDLASVQLWVRRHPSPQGRGPEAIPSRPRQWAKQVCRQRIFDALVREHRPKRREHPGRRGVELILIDHSRAFAQNEMPFVDEIIQTDRQLFEALKALDEAAAQRATSSPGSLASAPSRTCSSGATRSSSVSRSSSRSGGRRPSSRSDVSWRPCDSALTCSVRPRSALAAGGAGSAPPRPARGHLRRPRRPPGGGGGRRARGLRQLREPSSG